ncbi:MAG: hypothetical protein ACQCN6_01595 [Candidatus Bathyarchaeia archaeon]
MEEQIITIAVAIIGLIGTVLGAKYGKQYAEVKSKASKIADLFNTVVAAAEDDKVTEDEFAAIVEKAKAAVT